MFHLAFVAVLSAAIGAAAGLGVGWSRWKTPPTNNKAYRLLVISEHARQAVPDGGMIERGGTLIIGDSIIERQYITDVCGPVLNAGIGNAVVGDFEPHARAIIESYRPRRIVINLGINDAARGTLPDTFAASFRKLLASASTATTLVMGLPESRDAQYNAMVRELALESGALYVDYPVTREATLDGIHVDARGASQWQMAARQALCPPTQ